MSNILIGKAILLAIKSTVILDTGSSTVCVQINAVMDRHTAVAAMMAIKSQEMDAVLLATLKVAILA